MANYFTKVMLGTPLITNHLSLITTFQFTVAVKDFFLNVETMKVMQMKTERFSMLKDVVAKDTAWPFLLGEQQSPTKSVLRIGNIGTSNLVTEGSQVLGWLHSAAPRLDQN